jgi:hypothetical protein
MAEVTTNAPGTFCWPELAPTDQAGAVAFYRGLFLSRSQGRPATGRGGGCPEGAARVAIEGGTLNPTDIKGRWRRVLAVQ